MKKFTLCLFILINVLTVKAQELSDAYYSYLMNPFNVNPAFFEDGKSISAILNVKSYLSGFNNAPENTMFGFNAAVNNEQAVGLRILSDQRGAYEVSKYDLTYSHQLSLNKSADLRFGVSTGLLRRMLNVGRIDNIEFLDQGDPTLTMADLDEIDFVSGFGAVLTSKNFEVGLSSSNLIVGRSISSHVFGTVTYHYLLKQSNITLSPILIYQNIPDRSNQLDLLVKGEYKENVWIQVGGQSERNLHFGLGFSFSNIGIGYSYEMNNQEFGGIASGSNEVILRLGFANKKKVVTRHLALTKLDDYIERYKVMLKDNTGLFTKEFVANEMSRIQIDILQIEKENSDDQGLLRSIEQKKKVLKKLSLKLDVKYFD